MIMHIHFFAVSPFPLYLFGFWFICEMLFDHLSFVFDVDGVDLNLICCTHVRRILTWWVLGSESEIWMTFHGKMAKLSRMYISSTIVVMSKTLTVADIINFDNNNDMFIIFIHGFSFFFINWKEMTLLQFLSYWQWIKAFAVVYYVKNQVICVCVSVWISNAQVYIQFERNNCFRARVV